MPQMRAVMSGGLVVAPAARGGPRRSGAARRSRARRPRRPRRGPRRGATPRPRPGRGRGRRSCGRRVRGSRLRRHASRLSLCRTRVAADVEGAEQPRHAPVGQAVIGAAARPATRCSPCSPGRSSRSSRGRPPGRGRRTRPVVTGPRHGVPWATSTQTVPPPLHSWQTLWPGMTGRRPASSAVIDLEELVAVDRAAVELEVDRHVRRDGRRGRRGSRCTRDGRRRSRRTRRRRRSCAAPGSRRPWRTPRW